MDYETILKLTLERGFFTPSCEIYSDALAGFWDYGPLGLKLRDRYLALWRRELVRRDEMIEIDGTQIMSKKVFIASGHLESFADPIVRCESCSYIARADRLIQDSLKKIIPERLPNEDLDKMIFEYKINCPRCGGKFGKVSRFNMMFRIETGVERDEAYLRPETCQSIFTNFSRIFRIMRCKLPIAIAQFGKSFRNEISPRQSLIRLREFYQAEIEVFFNPKKANEGRKFDSYLNYKFPLALNENEIRNFEVREAIDKGIIPNKLVGYYLALLHKFYSKTGINMDKARFRILSSDERAFYAEYAFDFEVKTSLGWVELVACNYRTDYDLKGHSKVSGVNMEVQDDGEKVLPHVFELSMGIDRSLYCILEHSYQREKERNVLKIKPYLAPLQVGVFPLVEKDGLPEKAKEIYSKLMMDFDCVYDESGSIGRRYRRQDEIGTPFCLTIDHQTLKDGTLTLRFRDSMEQIRIHEKELKVKLSELLSYP